MNKSIILWLCQNHCLVLILKNINIENVTLFLERNIFNFMKYTRKTEIGICVTKESKYERY